MFRILLRYKDYETHVETEHILLLWHPPNEPVKGGNTLSGHQIKLSGAEEIEDGRQQIS